MRLLNVLFPVAAIALLASAGARAQMLAGTMQDVSTSSPYVANFTTGSYEGWAVYAMPESPAAGEGVPYTDSNNVANFSGLSGVLASGGNTDTGGAIELTFPYQLGGQAEVAPLTTVVHYATAGNSLSMTSSLFASAETFSFYLENYEGPTSVTAFLSGPGVTGSPTFSGSFSPLAGSSYGYDLLTLTVTGAQTNDILTFSLEDVTTGHAGIQGVAVMAPEPTSWMLLAVGAAGMMAWRRRTARVKRVPGETPPFPALQGDLTDQRYRLAAR